MGCSELNAHPHNYYVIENPKCACGNDFEDTIHHFFVYSAIAIQRDVEPNTVSTISSHTIPTTFYNWKSRTLEENGIIFEYVRKFIEPTKRFIWA